MAEELAAGQTVEEILDDPAQQEVAKALIEGTATPGNGGKGRSWFLNLLLVGLVISGGAMFVTLFLEYWIIDFDLLGDPSVVWAHAMWFLPQALVVVLALQTVVFKIATSPFQAPSVWMTLAAFVAFVFNAVVLVFYQRLFWQCVTNTGNFKALEDDICDNQLTELSTIAWFNVIFVAHSLVSIVTGVLVYSSDSARFEELRAKIKASFKGLRRRAAKAAVGSKANGQGIPEFVRGRLNHRRTKNVDSQSGW